MRHGSSRRAGEGWTVSTEGPDAGATPHWEGHFDASDQPGEVRLTLPAEPQYVALVRRVVGTLADSVALPLEVREDLRLAVTEACANVVRHAYREGSGEIELIARPAADSVAIIVSDAGAGVSPSPDTAGAGFGLNLISTLADRFEIEHSPGRGSRLDMWFARHRTIPETA